MAYRTFDHTADVGVEVWADGLSALLQECARAYRELTIAPSDLVPAGQGGGVPAGIETWSVEANDLGALVVSWLEQLLFLWDARGVMLVDVGAKVHGRSPWRATGSGRRAVPGPGAAVRTDIKAVTWHGLTVEEREDGWYARVIFDI